MLIVLPQKGNAYSVLTHQALIDASWDLHLKPMLKKRFPEATEIQLKEAHAYAYGGAIALDMGYYPFGSELFTNLTHYVRSGDFVMALIKEAKDLNAYAFALGSLCHYHADVYGHKLGTNPATALIYPKSKEKHGHSVTYAEDKIAHMRTEFSFDVLQTARGNYASKQYHDFIGFKIDTAVLETAFFQTYGLHIRDVFKNFNSALKMFRWSVAHFFPAITRTAWATKQSDIKKLNPTATARSFTYRMERRNRGKERGKEEERPTAGTKFIAFLIRISPKVGPLKVLKFKAPGPEAEKLFIQSFDTVLLHYIDALRKVQQSDLSLVNMDYDIGEPVTPCNYELTDAAYDALVLKLQKENFKTVTPQLRTHLLQFYQQSDRVALNNSAIKEKTMVDKAIRQLKVTSSLL
jgi:hypothetical protein